jgi:hypothetical protein
VDVADADESHGALVATAHNRCNDGLRALSVCHLFTVGLRRLA